RDKQFKDGDLKPFAQRSLVPIRTYPTFAPTVRKALAQKMNFNYDQTPLDSMLKDLQEKSTFPMVLDQKSLTEANVALDTPVSLKAKACRLSTGLSALLESNDLDWLIADEVLLV